MGKKYFKHKLSKVLNRETRLFISIVVLLLVACFIYFKALRLNKAEAAWYDDSFAYRQTVYVSNGTTSLSDFQISFTLNTSGTDAAGLVTLGKMKADCSDIRITDINNNSLPHWIEAGNPGCNNTATKIWTKLASLPNGTVPIYVYYGNPSAKNSENGREVFPAFDDFEKNNFSAWSRSYNWAISGTAYGGSYSAFGAGAYQRLIKDIPLTYTSVVEINVRFNETNKFHYPLHNYDYIIMTRTDGKFGYYDGSTYKDLGTVTSYSANTWYKIKLVMDLTNDQYTVYIDGQNKGTITDNALFNATPSYTQWVVLNTNDIGSGQMWVDNFFSRQFANIEPTASAPTNEEKSKAPSAFWKFDEGYGVTTYDSSSNGYNGTLGSGSSTPSWQNSDQCISEKCLYFDGTDDYVNSNKDFSWGSSESFSISVWFKLSSLDGVQGILGKGSAGGYGDGNWEYRLMIINGTADFMYFNTAGAGQIVMTTSSVTANKWNHLEVTYNPTNYGKLYLNGKLVDTSSAPVGTLQNRSTPLLIGHTYRTSLTNYYFRGFIDSVKIYNYDRSANEVKADYSGTKNHSETNKGASAVLGTNQKNGDELNNNLIGYYKMNESIESGTVNGIVDSSGNANNLTSYQAVSTGGKFGRGASFDGSNDYIYGSTASFLDIGTGSFTASAWIKASIPSGTLNDVILNKGGNMLNKSGYFWNINPDGKQEVHISNGTDWLVSDLTGNNVIADDSWQFLTFTWDPNSGASLYRNGVLDNSITLKTTDIISSTSPFLIGGWNTGTYSINGSIDEVRLYNRTLSPNEIKRLYNFAAPAVLNYDFNENTGTTVYDKSKNQKNGIFNGLSESSWVTGKYGSALLFNGTSSYISLGTNALNSVAAGAGAITMSAWVNVNDIDDSVVQPPVARLLIDDTGVGYQMRVGKTGGEQICIGSRSTSTDSYLETCTAYPLIGQGWIYLTGVVDYQNATVTTYANGALISSTTAIAYGAISYIPGIPSTDDRIGHHQTQESYFNGRIDDIKIYNYGRSASQINEDYNSGLTKKPILYYKFDEGQGVLSNNSGNGGNSLVGTLTNSPSWTNSGKFNKALTFVRAGTTFVTTPDNDALDIRTGSITVTFWAKSFIYTGSASIPISKGAPFAGCTGSSSVGYEIRQYTSYYTTRICYYDGTDVYQTVDSPGFNTTDGLWHHITAVLDRETQTMRMYIDGRRGVNTTTNFSNYDIDGSRAFTVGGRSNTHNFDGTLDAVKVFKYALTDEEVKADYNQGSALVLGANSTLIDGTTPSFAKSAEYCVPGDISSCSPPVLEWNFEEGSGTSATDNINGITTNFTATPRWQSGKYGKSLYFAGSDYLTSGTSSTLNSILSGISYGTVEAWVKAGTETGGDYRGIFNAYDSGDCAVLKGMLLDWRSSSQITGIVGNGAGCKRVTVNYNLSQNRYQHLAFVWSSTGMNLYIDGWLADSNSDTTPSVFVNNESINIGRGTGGLNWLGNIDQVRVYNYPRSRAQVAWDYNKGAPEALWKMDECQGTTIHDSSVNNLNATWNGAASGSQTSAGACGVANTAWDNGKTGKINASLNFDGIDDYLSINSSTIFGVTKEVSVSTWTKMTNDYAANAAFLIKNDSSDYDWALGAASAFPSFYIRKSNNTPEYISSTVSIQDNTWHHITGTFDGRYIKIYDNGILKNTNDLGAVYEIENDNSDLLIGKHGTSYYSGLIDDVRFYNYALTAAQVKTLYNNGAVRFGN